MNNTKMKPFSAAFLFLLLATAGCSSSGADRRTATVQPGQGSLTISVNPNPIRAQRVSGDVYNFPFEIIVGERGGAPVTIDRVSVEVTALGGLNVYSESYDRAEIERRGFSTRVPAGGEVRYAFNPRKDVTDDRLFSAVEAELSVSGTDTSGLRTTARTTVTVRR